MPESAERASSTAARAALYHESGAAHPDLLRIGRIPVSYFVMCVLSFAVGVCELPFTIGDIATYFYQPAPLAVVHTFTLGWITAAIMGVMYRYVPALTRRPIRWPRMAYAQLFLFMLGASGMVAHFEIGIWFGLWLAALVVVLSVLMFAANIIPCLWDGLGRGVAETGMFLSVLSLILAAVLGTLLGMDKNYNFMGGSVLTNLSAHAHLAALGWVTLSICAVSYRMLPAFLLPKVTIPRSATRQLYLLTAGITGLVLSLLFQPELEIWFTAAIAIAMVWYAAIIARLVRTRRMPLDWTPRHALAGIASLAAAIVLGMMLSYSGGDSEAGARIAPAYGAIGLLGFFSNFIIGMSYQLFPGFVTRSRSGLGWPAVTIAEISITKTRAFVFLSFNAGVLAIVAGFLAEQTELAIAGSLAVAAGGLVYCACILWTLSYAFRRAVPSGVRGNPLRIIPG